MHPRHAGIFFVLTIAACGELPTKEGTSPPSRPEVSGADFVANAIARALSDYSTRLGLLQDFRASMFSEHKLVLQDYLNTQGGTRLLASIRNAGVDDQEFWERVRTLPRTQFYLPARVQRETWTGGPDLLVISNFTPSSHSIAYAPSGAARAINLRRRERLLEATYLVLQHAEPMYQRITGPSLSRGSTVQDRSESDVGGILVTKDRAGRTIGTMPIMLGRLAFSDEQDPCPPTADDCFNTSVTGAALASGTYVTEIINHGVCDNACVFESLEFNFRSTAQFGAALYTEGIVTGVPSEGFWSGFVRVSPYRSFGSWVEIGIWETDSVSGDDPFVCQEFSVTYSRCPNFKPRVQVSSPGGGMAFALCENLPWACVFNPSDLEMRFVDKP